MIEIKGVQLNVRTLCEKRENALVSRCCIMKWCVSIVVFDINVDIIFTKEYCNNRLVLSNNSNV